MHISEGVMSAPVLLGGAVLAAAGTGLGLKKLDYDRIPQAAILTGAFFLASLVHVPIGAFSVHLVLNGLMGLLLGWAAFPAILIALTLQAVLFQFGGLTSLGVNTLNMALPAIVVYYLFGALARSDKSGPAAFGAFLAGAGAIFLAATMLGLSMYLTGESFLRAAQTAVIAHFPVMIAEGLFTALAVQFLKKVRPEILEMAYAH